MFLEDEHQPRDEHVISSQNRHKYFKRPVIPFMNMQPPEVLFASAAAAQSGVQEVHIRSSEAGRRENV